MRSKMLDLDGMQRRLQALGERFPDLIECDDYNVTLGRKFFQLRSESAQPRSLTLVLSYEGQPMLTTSDFAEVNDERVAVLPPKPTFVPVMPVLSTLRKLYPDAFNKLVEVTDMLAQARVFECQGKTEFGVAVQGSLAEEVAKDIDKEVLGDLDKDVLEPNTKE